MPKRVLLVNPPVPDNKVWIREGRCQQWDIWGAPFPPLGLANISTQLLKDDCETRIIDSAPEKKDIWAVIREAVTFQPEIAILSTTTPTIETDLGWFPTCLKEALPDILIGAVGIHVSTLPEEVLTRFDSVDFLIIGEPEISAREFVWAVTNGSPLESVKGVAYRNEGAVRLNPPREFIEDIDALGFPDWDKISFSNYLLPIKNRKFSLIGFSRGCPFSCTFCATHAYNGVKLRKRSVGSLIGEIRYNLTLGVHDFLFFTELMTGDKTYLNDFLDQLFKQGLHKEISWICNSRVDGIDYDLALRMKEAGCWQIAFGFEFGDDRMLKKVKKGGNASVARAGEAAETVNKAGIAVDGHFILGYPGETTRTMQKTMDLACSLPLTFAHFYSAVPFPGSTLYTEALRNGWIDKNDYALFTQDTANIKTDTLDTDTVERYIKKAYRSFYYNPATILRILKIPSTLREYAEVMRTGLRFCGLLRNNRD